MQDATAEILSVAGDTVAKDSHDLAALQLLVTERRVSPSWRIGWTRRQRVAGRPLRRPVAAWGHRTTAMQLADRSDFGPPRAVGGSVEGSTWVLRSARPCHRVHIGRTRLVSRGLHDHWHIVDDLVA
jgi:hypothetical protein